MGQYHKIVSIEKQQFLDAHKFGCGLKLMEFGCSSEGPLLGLAVLLAISNGRGGGDLHIDDREPDKALVGSWAGTRVVVVGDYADHDFVEEVPQARERYAALVGLEEGQLTTDDDWAGTNLYDLCSAGVFEDISARVIGLIQRNDGYALQDLDTTRERWDSPISEARYKVQVAERAIFDAVAKLVAAECHDPTLNAIARLAEARLYAQGALTRAEAANQKRIEQLRQAAFAPPAAKRAKRKQVTPHA